MLFRSRVEIECQTCVKVGRTSRVKIGFETFEARIASYKTGHASAAETAVIGTIRSTAAKAESKYQPT